MVRGGSRSLLPSSANERFHVIEITLEGAPACRRKAVLGFRQATVKHLGAMDISSFFELAGVYGEISIGGPEQSLQFVESEGRIHRQSADNSQPHALVDQPVEAGRDGLLSPTAQRGEARLLRMGFGNAFYRRPSQLSSHVASQNQAQSRTCTQPPNFWAMINPKRICKPPNPAIM